MEGDVAVCDDDALPKGPTNDIRGDNRVGTEAVIKDMSKISKSPAIDSHPDIISSPDPWVGHVGANCVALMCANILAVPRGPCTGEVCLTLQY
jgi:hypothetical protein